MNIKKISVLSVIILSVLLTAQSANAFVGAVESTKSLCETAFIGWGKNNTGQKCFGLLGLPDLSSEIDIGKIGSASYTYGVPKQTVAVPYPTGLSYHFGNRYLTAIRNGTLKYAANAAQGPREQVCNRKSYGPWPTCYFDGDDGAVSGYQRVGNYLCDCGQPTNNVCGGLPSGWGCYYIDDSRSDYYTVFYDYSDPIAAYPPSAVQTLSAKCVARPKSQTVGNKYTNIEFEAQVTNPGTSTTYTWYGDAIGASTRIANAYVSPNKPREGVIEAKAFVVVKSTYSNGTTQEVRTEACKTVPPPDKVTTTCIGKHFPDTDENGKFTNTRWEAFAQGGTDHVFSWSGSVQGPGKIKYVFVEPGKTASAKVSVLAKFPDGTVKSSAATACEKPITIPNIVAKCVATPSPSGIVGTENFTNYLIKAVTTEGSLNVTDKAKYEWTISSTTKDGVVSSDILPETSKEIKRYVPYGEQVTLSVVADLNGSRSANATNKCVIKPPTPKITATCKGDASKAGEITWKASASYTLDGIKYTSNEYPENFEFIWPDGTASSSQKINYPSNARGSQTKQVHSVSAFLTETAFDGGTEVHLDNIKCGPTLVCSEPQLKRENWGVTVYGGREDIRVDGRGCAYNTTAAGKAFVMRPCVPNPDADIQYGMGGYWRSVFNMFPVGSQEGLWRNYSWYTAIYASYPVNMQSIPNANVIGQCRTQALKDKCVLVTLKSLNGQPLSQEKRKFPLWDTGPNYQKKGKKDILDVSMGALRTFDQLKTLSLGQVAGLRVDVELVDKKVDCLIDPIE